MVRRKDIFEERVDAPQQKRSFVRDAAKESFSKEPKDNQKSQVEQTRRNVVSFVDAFVRGIKRPASVVTSILQRPEGFIKQLKSVQSPVVQSLSRILQISPMRLIEAKLEDVFEPVVDQEMKRSAQEKQQDEISVHQIHSLLYRSVHYQDFKIQANDPSWEGERYLKIFVQFSTTDFVLYYRT